MIFKWLTVPFSNQTKEVKVARAWEVRWQSRHGEYSGDVRPEVEVFLTREEAYSFVESLRNAFRLVRHKSGISVSVKERT